MAAQWGYIKRSFLAGESYKSLSEKYGVTVKTIQNRAYKEGWLQEKGKIEAEVGQKTHARVVRAKIEQLEKLILANEKVIDGLLAIAESISEEPAQKLYDKVGSLKNAESFAKAIQVAVATQRDLYRLPTLEQEQHRKEWLQQKRDNKAKMALEREKWEAAKLEKAKSESTASGTVWRVEEIGGDGDEIDG